MKEADNMLDRVIENITEDQKALTEQNDLIEKAKSYKREVQDRLKDSRRDLQTFVKYATPEQLKKLKELDLDMSESTTKKGELNPFSLLVLDALMKAKGNKMSNNELYVAYVDSVPKETEAESYTQFNIRIRQIFNNGTVSKKQLDANKSSRDDIITLNVKEK